MCAKIEKMCEGYMHGMYKQTIRGLTKSFIGQKNRSSLPQHWSSKTLSCKITAQQTQPNFVVSPIALRGGEPHRSPNVRGDKLWGVGRRAKSPNEATGKENSSFPISVLPAEQKKIVHDTDRPISSNFSITRMGNPSF